MPPLIPPEEPPLPEPEEAEYEPEHIYVYGYMFQTEDPFFIKEVLGDTIYYHFLEISVGIPTSWQGKYGIAPILDFHSEGEDKIFVNSEISFYLLDESSMGGAELGDRDDFKSSIFKIQCYPTEPDFEEFGVQAERFTFLGEGRLGLYYLHDDYWSDVSTRYDGYDWGLYEELHGDLDYIREHISLTLFEGEIQDDY